VSEFAACVTPGCVAPRCMAATRRCYNSCTSSVTKLVLIGSQAVAPRPTGCIVTGLPGQSAFVNSISRSGGR
jgi:hypothetical protein